MSRWFRAGTVTIALARRATFAAGTPPDANPISARSSAIQTDDGQSDGERFRHHHEPFVVQAWEQQDVGFLSHQAHHLLPRKLPEEANPRFHAQPTALSPASGPRPSPSRR